LNIFSPSYTLYFIPPALVQIVGSLAEPFLNGEKVARLATVFSNNIRFLLEQARQPAERI